MRQSSAHWLLFTLDLAHRVFLRFVGKVAYDLVDIIIYVWLNVGLPQFSSRIIFAHQIVGCLQERV